MPDLIRLACLLCTALCLPGCVPILTAMGSGSSVIALATQAERIKLAADAISYANSKKTLTDHGLSAMMGSDCTLFNVITTDPVCTPKNDVSVAEAAEDAEVTVAAAPRDELQTAPVALAAALPATSAAPVMLTAVAAPQASDNAGGDE